MWAFRNKNLLEVAKYVTAVVTIPATYHVFYRIFSDADRGSLLAGFTAVCSIILIDVLLLYFLYILEENSDPLKKWPDVFGAVSLAVANVAIGWYDEGALAWVPRVGLISLVTRDVFRWALDYRAFYNSFEAVESRLRKEQKIARRKLDLEMWYIALEQLRPDIELKQLENEIKLRQLDTSVIPDELVEIESGIFRRGRDYLWERVEGELVDTTVTGQPYRTLRGAKQARTKYLNQQSEW